MLKSFITVPKSTDWVNQLKEMEKNASLLGSTDWSDRLKIMENNANLLKTTK